MEVGGGDDDPRLHGNGVGNRNQRRRIGARAYEEQSELAWMNATDPFTWESVNFNCPENAMFRNKRSFEPAPPDSDDSDDSDDDENTEVNLASLQQIMNYGTNYPAQQVTAICAIILGIQIVNNVQVKSYQRGANQQHNRQNLTNQRMITLVCPQSAGGSNTFVIIDGKNSLQLWRNDPINRDEGTIGKKSIILCIILLRSLSNLLSFIHSYLSGLGKTVLVLRPMIRNHMGKSNLPIIETLLPLVALKPTLLLPTVLPTMMTTRTSSFILHDCTVTVRNVSVTHCPCSGAVCDLGPFSIGYNQTGAKACACMRGNQLGSQTAPMITANIECSGVSFPLVVESFISKRFTEDFIVKNGSLNTVSPHHYMNQIQIVSKKIRKIFKYINGRGGWTIIGWYRQAMVEDVGANQNQNNVAGGMNQGNNNNNIEAGHANLHIVRMVPTSPNMINRVEFERKKIDLDQLISGHDA